jgi:hypothetical protein
MSSLTASSHPISRHQAQSQYLKAVAPVTKAEDTFEAVVANDTTAAQATILARPMVQALTRFDTVVSKDRWPKGVTADIHALVVANRALISAVQPWNNPAVTVAGPAQIQDATIIRHDLGLPQATAVTTTTVALG